MKKQIESQYFEVLYKLYGKYWLRTIIAPSMIYIINGYLEDEEV